MNPAVLAQEAEAGVAQDAVEPGQERLRGVIALTRPEDLEEGLLTEFHGVVPGTHQRTRDLESPSPEGPGQVVERSVVSRLDGGHETGGLTLHGIPGVLLCSGIIHRFSPKFPLARRGWLRGARRKIVGGHGGAASPLGGEARRCPGCAARPAAPLREARYGEQPARGPACSERARTRRCSTARAGRQPPPGVPGCHP